MLNPIPSTPSQAPEDREVRIQALVARPRPDAEQALRATAERLVDLPEDQSFGQVEYDLRDLSHGLAAVSHQTALRAGNIRTT
jgi:hypothetical protein